MVAMVRARLLTVDIAEEVVSLQTLAGQGVGSGLSTEEQQFSLETLGPTKALTVRVLATF